MSTTQLGEGKAKIALYGSGTPSLEKFRVIISRDRIRAAARAALIRNAREDRVVVFLNKQVAHAGHVSFCEPEGESPLGPIRLEIVTDDSSSVIGWLAGEFERRQKK